MRPLLRPLSARPIAGSSSSRFLLVRNFHATRPAPLITEALSASTGFLHAVHSVSGLPWVASIPLTAFVVRTFVALPLHILARKHARQKTNLLPLIMSYNKHLKARIDQTKMIDRAMMRENSKQQQTFLKEKTKDIYRRWGVSQYAAIFPFLQLPIWLTLMEGVRALCGVNAGLFRYFLPAGGSPEAGTLPVMEPTLATEGALWFPNLLAGDPTGCLSIILTLTLVVNVQKGWKAKSLAEASDFAGLAMVYHLWNNFLKTGATALGIYIGLMSYLSGMPAGMMLYWITSSNIATLQSIALSKVMFARKPLQPWTRKYARVLRTGEKVPPTKPLL